MRVYEVTYTTNDYSADLATTLVAAFTAARASEYVGKKNGKFVRYSGRVTSVTELYPTVHIAK